MEVEAHMNRLIAAHMQQPFAVVMFDVNGLKTVNDTSGHQSGDRYLKDASKIICDIFKRSPVFRVGGDEFIAISQGKDYANIEELMNRMASHNTEAFRMGGIVIACGMARFDHDPCVAAVLERADHEMYRNKKSLKAHNTGV